MVCDECKNCWNYMTCENGCYGSNKPCEHLITAAGNMEPDIINTQDGADIPFE